MPEISKIVLPDNVEYEIKDAKARMVILKYGISTWNDFITAYNNNCVVYCRASSNSNPASGSQTRLAFMAYVDNADNPTNVEFQYYRSLNKHTDSQQGDQVFVYKLTTANTWTVTTRNAFSKVIAGDNITSTFVESGTNSSITLNADYDSTVTSSSTKLITSGAVSSALADKQDKIVLCTQSQFDTWLNTSFPYTDCKYIVTDAPNTNGTSEDLSYDGGVTSTHDVIEDIKNSAGGTLSIPTGISATLNRGWVIKQGRICVITANIALSGSASSGTTLIALPEGFTCSNFVDCTAHDGNSNVVRIYITGGYVYAYQTIASGTTIYFNATYIN